MADEPLPVQSGILDPLIGVGYFTPNMSLEEIKRRRAIGAAIASRSRPFPKTIGEGLTYFGEALAEGRAERQLAEAEKAYSARRDADMPGAIPPVAPVAGPRPVADVPSEVVPPPVATATALPPVAARPSPLPPAPAGPMPGVGNRADITRALAMRNPAMADMIAQIGGQGAPPPGPMVTANASLASPNAGAAPAGPMPNGATFASDEGPNPPTVSRDIKPMLVAEAAGPRPTAPPFGLRGPDASVRNPIVRPPEPEMAPAGKEERAWELYRQKYINDPDVVNKADRAIEPYKQKRQQDYTEKRKEWDILYADYLKQQGDERAYERGLPKAQLDYTEQQQKVEEARKRAALEDRLGGRKVEDFVKDFKVEHAEANKQISALNSLNEAENAIKAGAITGYGRNARLDAERMQAWMLGNKKSGDVAAQSQILQSTLQGTLSVALAKFQGGDSRVTEGDLKAAQGLIGTPDMQKEAILKLTAIAKEEAHNRIDAFEERRHKRIGGTPLEDDFPLTTRPTASPSSIQKLLDNKDDPNIKAHFDNTFGPGSAQLEINRARRAAERRR